MQINSIPKNHYTPINPSSDFLINRRVDFFVEGKIMVELKAISQLERVHIAQALNYAEAYKMEVALLINFGESSLKFHRINNNKL